ncbi:hypothetical protein POVWA2_019010 [Plasmodium ovale wallikeri]|uniref:Uncharacterized protein n=1 Tax=Plasmodium ovale wallikeri TaxID=864142 RepID=A0A1A8YRJ4_PLAOA|nr:hypothetical protein POVWA2_019010 [Plasmodium ovale wallikeri]
MKDEPPSPGAGERRFGEVEGNFILLPRELSFSPPTPVQPFLRPAFQPFIRSAHQPIILPSLSIFISISSTW